MSKYVIEGGRPLRGTVRASGNKNAALPCIAATLLTDEPVVLRNIPDIEDVRVMLNILAELGATVEKIGDHEYRLQTEKIRTVEIPPELARSIRASILFAGPLLARAGKVLLSPPGGDVIGRRRLDTHFLAFSELGAKVEIDGIFRLSAEKLAGVEVFLDEASVTATENAIMAASMAQGVTVIRNAASEPHVQDLCRLINEMGGRIGGIGSNIVTIEGVKSFGGADYRIGSDLIEVGSFIGLAAVTRSELVIEDATPGCLRMTKIAFAKMGIRWECDGDVITVPSGQELKVVPDMGGMIPTISDEPWPGLPSDLMSIMTVVATQVDGTLLLHEKMFDSRMFFVDKLIGMGARIVLCDPHRAVVSGPARLKGDELVSPDIRAGMSMLIAALCADGTSVIRNVYQIERGYERLVERLCGLGARIDRQED